MGESISNRPPYYIVGLPEEPAESQEAESKFERPSADLCPVYPFIEEIRAVARSKKASGTHPRCGVSVEIYTPRDWHAFSETGYKLATTFEALEPKMKRPLSSRRSRVTAAAGRSYRKREEA